MRSDGVAAVLAAAAVAVVAVAGREVGGDVNVRSACCLSSRQPILDAIRMSESFTAALAKGVKHDDGSRMMSANAWTRFGEGSSASSLVVGDPSRACLGTFLELLVVGVPLAEGKTVVVRQNVCLAE